WFPENGLAIARINGIESDPSNFGTRYISIGYESLGSARDDAGSSQALDAPPQTTFFDQVQTRQQVPQFVVTGPARVTYKWAIQHRIQTSTSSSSSEALPLIDVDDVAAKDGEGSHEFWFDRGTALKILARERAANTQLNGWLI